MGLFRDKKTIDTDGLDWRLLQNGAITLFHKPIVLTEAIIALTAGGYTVFELEAQGWAVAADFYGDVKRVLGFHEKSGTNLASLIDGLTDLKFPKQGGLAIVIRHFDAFAKRERDVAQTALDAFETASRNALLHGHRLLALVQSDDPAIRFERVGARPVCWNPREWLDETRRPSPRVQA